MRRGSGARRRRQRTPDVPVRSARTGRGWNQAPSPPRRSRPAVRERSRPRRLDRDALHPGPARPAGRNPRRSVPRHRLGFDDDEARARGPGREVGGARLRDEPRRAARRVPARTRNAAPGVRRMRRPRGRRRRGHRLRRGSRARGVWNRPRPRRNGGAPARGPRPRARRELRARHRRPGHEGALRAPGHARPDRRQRGVLVGLRDVSPDLRRGALAHLRAAGRRRVPIARPPRPRVAVHGLHELDGEAGAPRRRGPRGHRRRPRLLGRAQLPAEGPQAPGLRRARGHHRGAGRHVPQPGRAPGIRDPDGPARDLPGPGGPGRRVGRGAARPRRRRGVAATGPLAIVDRRPRRAPQALLTLRRLRQPLPRYPGRFRGCGPARDRQSVRARLSQRTGGGRPAWHQPPGSGTRPVAAAPVSAIRSAAAAARRPAARPGHLREPPLLDLAARPARPRSGPVGHHRSDDGRGRQRLLLLGQRLPAGADRQRASGATRRPGCRSRPVPDGGVRSRRGGNLQPLQLPHRHRLPGGGGQQRARRRATADASGHAAGVVQEPGGVASHREEGARVCRHRCRRLRHGV